MKREELEGQKKIQQSVDRSDTKPKDGPIGPCEKKRKSRSEPGIEKLFFHFLFLSVRGSLGRTLRRGRGALFLLPLFIFSSFPGDCLNWRGGGGGGGRGLKGEGEEEFSCEGGRNSSTAGTGRPKNCFFFLPHFPGSGGPPFQSILLGRD